MIPLKDNVRTLRFPIVTIVLILVNIGVYVWQVSFPTAPTTRPAPGVNQRDESTIDYGAIPYRLLHPGDECAAGAVKGSPAQADLDRLRRHRRIPEARA